MKKFIFGATALIMMTACSSNANNEQGTNDSMPAADTMAVVDTLQAPPSEMVQDEAPATVATDTAAQAKAEETVNAEAAKYDPMLKEFKDLISQCWALSKKGMTINDQKLADIWMKAGDVCSKLNKAKKKLTPEQQAEFKKLDKDFTKFCQTQPA